MFNLYLNNLIISYNIIVTYSFDEYEECIFNTSYQKNITFLRSFGHNLLLQQGKLAVK